MQIGKGRYEDSVTRAGKRSCVYEIDMRRGKGGVKDAPTPYLGLQGLVALRRTCRPCPAPPPSSGFWPKSLWQLRPLLANLVNTFHLFHLSSSRIPSLNLLHRLSFFTSCSLYASVFFVPGICIVGDRVAGVGLLRLSLPKQPGFTNCF
jgi:hypothetical protein